MINEKEEVETEEEETNLEYYFRYIIENLFYSGTIATFMICVTVLILYWQRG